MFLHLLDSEFHVGRHMYIILKITKDLFIFVLNSDVLKYILRHLWDSVCGASSRAQRCAPNVQNTTKDIGFVLLVLNYVVIKQILRHLRDSVSHVRRHLNRIPLMMMDIFLLVLLLWDSVFHIGRHIYRIPIITKGLFN